GHLAARVGSRIQRRHGPRLPTGRARRVHRQRRARARIRRPVDRQRREHRRLLARPASVRGSDPNRPPGSHDLDLAAPRALSARPFSARHPRRRPPRAGRRAARAKRTRILRSRARQALAHARFGALNPGALSRSLEVWRRRRAVRVSRAESPAGAGGTLHQKVVEGAHVGYGAGWVESKANLDSACGLRTEQRARAFVAFSLSVPLLVAAGCKVADKDDFTYASSTSANTAEQSGGSSGGAPGTSRGAGGNGWSGGAPAESGGSAGHGGDDRDGFGGTSSETGGAAGASPETGGSAGADSDPEQPESECSEGALTCAGARELWVCENGQWVVEETCLEAEICDESGPECAPIPEECVGRAPGEKFCEENTRSVCSADLLDVDSTECEGRCTGGECAPITCGDGQTDPGEECDDGN